MRLPAVVRQAERGRRGKRGAVLALRVRESATASPKGRCGNQTKDPQTKPAGNEVKTKRRTKRNRNRTNAKEPQRKP